jgi:hypothetical protein
MSEKEYRTLTHEELTALRSEGSPLMRRFIDHIDAQSQTIAELKERLVAEKLSKSNYITECLDLQSEASELTAKLDCGHEKRYLSNLDDDCGEPDCEAVEVCALCFAKQAYAKLDAMRGLVEKVIEEFENLTILGSDEKKNGYEAAMRTAVIIVKSEFLSILDAPTKPKEARNGDV